MIKKINLKQLRNHRLIELTFDKPFAYIHGLNGSGKTSILEAIYFCATTKSHRTSDEKDLIIPNMRGIMQARTKAITIVEPTNNEAATKAVKFEKPAPKSAVKLISPDNLDELIDLLHNEAKVI